MEERRFRAVHATSLVVLAAAPGLAGAAGSLAFGLGVGSTEAVALGLTTLAVGWGFLGSIAWTTARSVEVGRAALDRARARRAPDPGAGQLSLGAPVVEGTLSFEEPARPGCLGPPR